MKVNNLVKILYSLLVFLPAVALAQVPTTFNTGDPIIASEMNNNFSNLDGRATTNALNIADHETRIQAIETGNSGQGDQTIQVDCSTDPEALRNLATQIISPVDGVDFTFFDLAQDNVTYEITGICNGPVSISKRRNVKLVGARSNKTLDGIRLPAAITVNPFAAVGVYSSIVDIRDLTIDALNYVAGSGNPWGSGISSLAVSLGSIARIFDTDIKGGDWALDVARNSLADTRENVTITDFNVNGAVATNGGHIRLRDNIQVVSTLTSTSSFTEAVAAWRGGTVEISNGGTITPGTATEQYALSAGENGTIRVRDNGVNTTNLNGIVMALRSASVRIQGTVVTGPVWAGHSAALQIDNSTVTGDIDAFDLGWLRLINTSQSGGFVSSTRSSVVRIQGTSIINATSISSSHNSNLGLRDTASINSSGGPLGLSRYSTVYIRDGVNMNNIGIICQEQANQVSVNLVNNTTVGDLSGCL